MVEQSSQAITSDEGNHKKYECDLHIGRFRNVNIKQWKDPHLYKKTN